MCKSDNPSQTLVHDGFLSFYLVFGYFSVKGGNFSDIFEIRLSIDKRTCQITALPWISSATCCGISSMRSIVYHRAAGRCTLVRYEIQGRFTALDDIHLASRGDDMPSKPAGLDKKIHKSKLVEFFGSGIGVFAFGEDLRRHRR